MKKFSVLFIFILFSITSSYSANYNAEITKIENSIYGYDYTNDTDQNRVARLEKTIYGKCSSGDINKRLKRISGDICADVIGLEIKPVRDTFLEEEKTAEESSNVNYPLVDEIEMTIFKKTYPERDFHTRIVTIERKLFGKIYDVDDYSTRMDRIKAKIMPEHIAKMNKYHDDGSYYDNNTLKSTDLFGTNQSRFSMPFGQKKYTRPYSNYGNFNENSNSNQSLGNELTQMEYDAFGTEFSNESTESRIKRLNSVNKAKKSAKKYDSQKFAQRMSAAMEIGAMILMVLAMIL
ncbi:hypothetical protein IKQ21_03575 [bacterium]|nr:hypothetical protein [bacterium]